MREDIFELSRRLVRLHHREYRRYFVRHTTLESRCSIIVGQRGVGKTTAVMQHLVATYPDYASSRQCLYVPADHFTVARIPMYEMARDFADQGGRLLCVDEIHKCADWSGSLKSIYDTFPELRIVASGSSMLQIHKGTHDLSRRAVVYRMTGMSFREFMELRLGLELPVLTLDDLLREHESVSADIAASVEEREAKVLGLFRDYLEFGFYPYFLEYQNLDLFRMTLEQNVHTAIESDLVSLHPTLNGNSITKIKKLLAIVAASVPFTPDLVKLRRLLDIADDRTLKTYFGYLEEAGLIMTVSRAGRGLRSLEKPAKIYLGDTNQVYALRGHGEANLGNVRETFFCHMVSMAHSVRTAPRGDFLVDDAIVFEVGGRSKTARQIRGEAQAFLALDDIETGAAGRIPLWLFGFLY